MNASDIVMYGNRTLLRTLERVPQSDWEKPGVCGFWSVRQIVCHLASHELVLTEILGEFAEHNLGKANFNAFARDPLAFNDAEVEKRAHLSPAEALAEYEQAQAEVSRLVGLIPETTLRRVGTIPWYGAEYALDDLIVYSNYGHKREHSAQVAVFADTLGS